MYVYMNILMCVNVLVCVYMNVVMCVYRILMCVYKCVLGERKYGLLNLKSIIGFRILLKSNKVVSGERKEYRKLCAEKYVVEAT